MFKKNQNKKFFYTNQHFLLNEGSSIKLKYFFLFKNFCLKNDLTLINIEKSENLRQIIFKRRLK